MLALATALEIEFQGMKETETGLFVNVAQWLEPPHIGDLGFYSQQNSQPLLSNQSRSRTKIWKPILDEMSSRKFKLRFAHIKVTICK